MEHRLSTHTLNILKDCERCFWLWIKKDIKRPRGIFPSLPNGMDSVLKKYFDGYRAKGELPPETKKELSNFKLWPDQKDMDKWRDWRSGLTYKSPSGITLIGALDDLVVDKKDIASPFDYKTRGYPPKSIIDSEQYYGLQLSVYSLLLKVNKFDVSGSGYLAYYWPEQIGSGGMIQFNNKMVKIPADPQQAIELCVKAIELLKSSKPPAPNPACEYCGYIDKLM